MTDRLFPIEEVPEVPLLREPRRRAGAARGVALDARFLNDYPLEWHRCPTCAGNGQRWSRDGGKSFAYPPLALAPDDPRMEGRFVRVEGPWKRVMCQDCLGMGSAKARARLEAGHRCERCQHPYVPKGDADMLGVPPSWRDGGWSACDERCHHAGPVRVNRDGQTVVLGQWPVLDYELGRAVEAAWRILTVHHLDGDKANLQPWNLAVLCQRDHLLIQHKVVMERVYPQPHTPWFRWHAAGYYAWVYLGERLTRPEIEERIDELLDLELAPATEGAA